MKAEDIMRTIALYEFAVGADKDVPGLKGFAAYYRGSVAASSKRLLNQWAKIKEETRKGILAEFDASDKAQPREVTP